MNDESEAAFNSSLVIPHSSLKLKRPNRLAVGVGSGAHVSRLKMFRFHPMNISSSEYVSLICFGAGATKTSSPRRTPAIIAASSRAGFIIFDVT